MPRGQLAKPGDTMVNRNGYHHTKTEEGWRLTHHVLAEEVLGRPLATGEMVRFKDGDRTNLDKDNLEIIPTRTSSIRRQLARVEFKLAELTALKRDLENQLARAENKTRD